MSRNVLAGMKFDPEDLTSQGIWDVLKDLLDGRWLAILQHSCDFPPSVFEHITLNLVQNPNINSSLLFRADVLYDSFNENGRVSKGAGIPPSFNQYTVPPGSHKGYELTRTIVRRMIPRNPQLDRPIAQTCQIFHSTSASNVEQTLVIYIPHVSHLEELPWYHPSVQSLVYLHTWPARPTEPDNEPSIPVSAGSQRGTISVHYRLFLSQSLSLSPRLLRTAHQLLSTLHKHGQGSMNGYIKRVHHDQIVPQQRVQDTYTRLKARHAKRLCDNWAEKTDSSKHAFEDLSIAAFLIELWKDMYRPVGSRCSSRDGDRDEKPEFPGFVDIGCGNGILVDILLREGYKGWGFDARNRKSWAILDFSTQYRLKQMVLIPQPLIDVDPSLSRIKGKPSHSLTSRIFTPSSPLTKAILGGAQVKWHNGIFPAGTFIISNHADELTAWTPLLAHLSSSPFLAIPCCSHNLSGLRFRAPSKFNDYSADTLAPSYFASNVTRTKHVAITVASVDAPDDQPRQGSLKDLSQESRAKQPSAYAALCDWVSHLAAAVGFEVEKEMLRLPSTRNTGLIGRYYSAGRLEASSAERMNMVKAIAKIEGADGTAWVEQARSLMGGKVTER